MFDATVLDASNKVIVVIDIFRATSTMTVGMENGAKAIYPVKDVATASKAGASFIKAGERNGVKVEGFDLGNSPREFTADIVRDRDIVMTTTNGTRSISMSESAKQILISSYRNIQATIDYLVSSREDVVLFCSGWKDVVNIEDTLFAGELASALCDNGFEIDNDATHIAMAVYEKNKTNIDGFLQKASHVKRIKKLQSEGDVEACLRRNTCQCVLEVKDGKVVQLETSTNNQKPATRNQQL